MGKLLSEIVSHFDERLESPPNGAWEIVSRTDGVDTKDKEIGIDPDVNTLIDNPQNGSITSRNDDSDIGLMIINKFLDFL